MFSGPRLYTDTYRFRIERVRMILPVINLAWYILIITLVEVTLHQNRAIGTLVSAKASTSPAQLIPFLVGVVSLARLIWMKCKDEYKSSKPESKSRFEDLNPFVVEKNNRAHSSASPLGGVGANGHGPHTGESK